MPPFLWVPVLLTVIWGRGWAWEEDWCPSGVILQGSGDRACDLTARALRAACGGGGGRRLPHSLRALFPRVDPDAREFPAVMLAERVGCLTVEPAVCVGKGDVAQRQGHASKCHPACVTASGWLFRHFL